VSAKRLVKLPLTTVQDGLTKMIAFLYEKFRMISRSHLVFLEMSTSKKDGLWPQRPESVRSDDKTTRPEGNPKSGNALPNTMSKN
jgi:hypothetical protein